MSSQMEKGAGEAVRRGNDSGWYDSRVYAASAGRNGTAHSHLANLRLVGQIGFRTGGSLSMTTTKQNGNLNWRMQTASAPGRSCVLPCQTQFHYETESLPNHAG